MICKSITNHRRNLVELIKKEGVDRAHQKCLIRGGIMKKKAQKEHSGVKASIFRPDKLISNLNFVRPFHIHDELREKFRRCCPTFYGKPSGSQLSQIAVKILVGLFRAGTSRTTNKNGQLGMICDRLLGGPAKEHSTMAYYLLCRAN